MNITKLSLDFSAISLVDLAENPLNPRTNGWAPDFSLQATSGLSSGAWACATRAGRQGSHMRVQRD